MKFNYIYIDESGDLGKNGSKYLVLSALVLNDPSKLDRIIKNVRRNKFRKELNGASEIKANRSSDSLRIHLLNQLNLLKDAGVMYIVLEKKKIFSEFLSKDKNRLYNYVAGKLARQLVMDDCNVEIRVDRRFGRQLLREEFNNYFIKCLKENSNPYKVTIEHCYSHNFSGLQFADILAWSCFQKFEYGNSFYIDILKLNQEVYHVW